MQITIGNRGNLGTGEVVFPKKSTQIYCPVSDGQPWNHTHELRRLCSGIYVYTYIHAINISEKGGYEFEGKWGGLHGRVWRGEWEAGNEELNYKLKQSKRRRRGGGNSIQAIINEIKTLVFPSIVLQSLQRQRVSQVTWDQHCYTPVYIRSWEQL